MLNNKVHICLYLKNIKLPVEIYAPVPRFKWHQYFGSISSSPPPPTAIPQCTSVSTGLPCVNDTLSFILFYASSSPLLLLALPWVVINLLHKFMSHFLFVLLGCRSKIKPDKYTKWTLRAAAINPPPCTVTFLYLCFMKCWLIPQIFLRTIPTLRVQWHPRNNMLTLLLIRCCKPERVVSSELRCHPCPWESVSTTMTTTRLKCEPCPCPLTLSNTEFRTNELLELWANIRGYPFTRISALPERNLIMRRIWNYIGQWMGLSASV